MTATTTTTTTTTTKSGKVVRIRVRNVGINFGCVGEIVSLNGRVVATTSACRPRGSAGRRLAEADAIRLAETL